MSDREIMKAKGFSDEPKKRIQKIKDGIGDMVVVLTNLAELCDLTIEECVESAWDEISNRTGKMENGTFVKD